MKTSIEDKMQVDFVFGALLERFFIDFRAKLGAKLDQVGTKIRKINIKTTSKNYFICFDFIGFRAQKEPNPSRTTAGGDRGVVP